MTGRRTPLIRRDAYEVLSWGLSPKVVTGDTWYASVFNLKMCRRYGLDACFAVEKDRLISTQKGQYQQVSEAEIPADRLRTHLRAFDWVTLFRTETKGQQRHYVYYSYQKNKTPCKKPVEKLLKKHMMTIGILKNTIGLLNSFVT